VKEYRTKNYVRRAFKAVLWILAGIAGLIILSVAALQVHGVQQYIAQKVLSSISDKTNTRIEVGGVSIAFTHSVVLKNVFVESKEHDTLLAVHSLAVDVNLLSLLSHDINVTNIRIDSLTAHVTRTLPDSSFNFDFIVHALSSHSSPAVSNPDTMPGPHWDIRLGGLSLNSVLATYDDDVSGLKLRIRLGTLHATVDKFDLDKMKFHVDKVLLTKSAVGVTLTKISPPDTSQSSIIDIGGRSVSLSDIHFVYENMPAGERCSVDLGTSALLADTVDLPSHRIAIKNLSFENTSVALVFPNREHQQSAGPDDPALPWVISLDQLRMDNNRVRYDVPGKARRKSVDLNHFLITALTMRGEKLHYSTNSIAADIGHASFRESSGFEVRDLSGRFVLDSLHAQLEDFTVETPASRIHPNILLGYTSISAFRKSLGSVKVDASIVDSHLAVSDLLFFEPNLPILNTPGALIGISSQLSGRIGDLKVEELHIAAGDSTMLDLTGSIRGLPKAATADFDVKLNLFSTGRGDIQSLVADSLLPKNIVLPSFIRISGMFKGTARTFSASTAVVTSIGKITGNAQLNSGAASDSIDYRWKADVVAEEFNVGRLLGDTESFGPVTLKASAIGTGLREDDIKARLDAEVEKAVVNGYPYRRLSLHGTASPKMFDGQAEIQDSNIVFTFNGMVNTSEENPNFKFKLDLKGADLRRLNLASDDVRVAGIIVSDLTGDDLNKMNGVIGAHNVEIVKNDKRYVIDSLVYGSVNKNGQTHLSIESAMFAGQCDGTIALSDLPEMLKEHVAHYFMLQGVTRASKLRREVFTFRMALRDPTILTDVFFPQLHGLSAGNVEGNFDSDNKILNFTIAIPTMAYEEITVDSLTVNITSDANVLHGMVKAGSITDSILQVTNLQVSGTAGHDSILAVLRSAGGDGSTKMLLAGVFNSVQDGYRFRFSKDGIVFRNVAWSVPPDNYFLFSKKHFIAHDVMVRGAGQSISLISTDEKDPRSPLKIEFNHFDLATLSHVVERETGLLGGILTGDVVLQNMGKQMAFTSDLRIKDFSFGRRLIGDISLRANDRTENVYDVNMDIAGNGNLIAIQGKYLSETGGSKLDINCAFAKLNLASVEPFTFGEVKRLSGTMTGGLHMTGTIKKPSITGNLNFNNTAFTPTFLDTYLHLNNGRIDITARGVAFTSFDLLDTLGNTASLSGRLLTEDFRNYGFDFEVHTKKFLLLHKPASRDALYYGTVIFDSDISVKGNQTRPIINMQAELDKGTNLALVLPESELAVEERGGIVKFVDVRTPPNSIMFRKKTRTDDDSPEAKTSSIDFTSNITVNKDSKLRILIDPVSGDSLVIQGEATFSFAVDPAGKLTVTGRYEILDGSYQLSFGDFIKREFAISKGSSLTWFGSPFDADVDITAVYTVNAAVLDLVQDQLAGISQEERNKYKQELPIQVFLMMKGKLLKPDIHFKLDMAPDQRGALNGSVYQKLNELNGQESELNQQVFALLVLGRFIPENPLASAGDNGALTDLARSSASQILSTQLNRLSEHYVAGVNLNVGLDSYQDYSTGSAEGRTQLKLALSKQLFDERMTVQVGGNVDLEGRRSQENSINNIAGDLSALYKLTKDGRWQLQVFRQDTYEGAIDGDITKTGVGLVFTIDFDKLFGFTLKPDPDKEEK